jgi:predicted RNA-binding Zn ribbon-like protein
MLRQFEFKSGSPALDLADTVSGRGRSEVDLLTEAADLASWLEAASFYPAPQAAITAANLRSAVELRAAIAECVEAAISVRKLPSKAVEVINAAAARPVFRPQLVDGAVELTAADPVSSAFSLIAEDAIELLTAPTIQRLRACPGCNMLFVDRSRPGRRRWCSSSSGCGNRAKVSNFRKRAKRKGQPHGR